MTIILKDKNMNKCKHKKTELKNREIMNTQKPDITVIS